MIPEICGTVLILIFAWSILALFFTEGFWHD